MGTHKSDLLFFEIPHGLLINCDGAKLKTYYNILKSSELTFDELVPAYHSIGILKRDTSFKELKVKVKTILSQVSVFEKQKEGIIQTIPILYYNENSDLAYLAEKLHLSEQEIIAIHSSTIYEVALIGFLPGFVYLSGLDTRLHHARKQTPRTHVSEGSIGIAGHQTGIYPCDSPGGWQIIGTTPLKMFDPNSATIVPFEIGSKVKFEVITQEEYGKLKKHD